MDTADFKELLDMECLKELKETASLAKEVSSVFVSNTYVAHSSIVSGCLPFRHKVIENLVFSPDNPKSDWNWYENQIKTNTIIREAKKSNLKVATFLWPVTAKGLIDYNLPEIFSNKKYINQIMVSLLNGSKIFQLNLFLKYKHLLEGIKQPNLDDFTLSCLLDTLKNRKHDMSFVHFTDVDTNKHLYGPKSKEAKEAVARNGERVSIIIKKLKELDMYKNCTIFIFGDHGMLEIKKEFNPNNILAELGYIKRDKNGLLLHWDAWFQTCGGCAMLRIKNSPYAKLINDAVLSYIDNRMKKTNYPIKRILTKEEMRTSGFDKVSAFGIEANYGVSFYEIEKNMYKGNHGYSLAQKNYTTSIIAVGVGIAQQKTVEKACITDICPTALKVLGLNSWEMDGSIISEFIV